MNDLGGVTGAPQPTNVSKPYEAGLNADEVNIADRMRYEGIDTMSAVGLPLFNFGPKSSYEGSLQNPELPLPDPEGLSGPQPYGMSEQKLIKQNIGRELLERLKKKGLSTEDQEALYSAILSGKTIKDPNLANIAKEIVRAVNQSIREGAHLPASWTIYSTSPEDWTPVPIKPYSAEEQSEINAYYGTAFDQALKAYAEAAEPPLSPEMVAKIATAFSTGNVPSEIASQFEAVSKQATEMVQKKYGLPNTWFRGTTSIEDWKPIHLGIVTPNAVNFSRGEFILGNIEEYGIRIENAVKNTLGQIPPDDPIQLAGAEYLTIISQAIRELKAMLREIQVEDAERARETQKVRIDLTEDRQKVIDKQIEKQKEMKKKEKKAEDFGFAMKIVGPIIAALATVAGAVLTVVTLGVAAPGAVALIAAGIIVGTAMTAYSIADSVTGCTGKLIESFNSAIEKLAPGNEFVQKLIKAAIIIAIVVVLIIAVVLSGGGAAANASAQISAQVIKQVVLETIKQLSLQMIMITIMASNAIPEVIGAMLRSFGVDEETSKYIEMAVMVFTMFVAMLGVTKAISSSAAGASAGASQGVVASVKQLGQNIVDGTRELIKQVAEGAEAAIKELVRILTTLINKLLSFAKQIPDKLQSAYKSLADAAENLLNVIQQGRTIEELTDALVSFARVLRNFGETALDKSIKGGIAIIKAARDKTGRELTNMYEGIKEGFLPFKIAKYVSMYRRGEELPMQDMGYEISLSTSRTLQMTSGVTEAIDGVTRGVLGVKIAGLLEEIGEDKQAEMLYQVIIDELNKLLQSLTEGMDANAEVLRGANQFLTNLYAGQSEMATKIARSGQA